MKTKLFLAPLLLPILMMLLVLQPASAQNCGWFSDFKPGVSAYGDGHWGLDSIPFSTRLVQQKMVKEICCYEFEVAYKGDTRTFCIGIADSTVYTFKNNRFRDPRKLLSLMDEASTETTFFTEPCSANKMAINSTDPYFDTIVIYELTPAQPFGLFPGMMIQKIQFHSTRGLFLDFSLDGEFWTYGTLGYL